MSEARWIDVGEYPDKITLAKLPGWDNPEAPNGRTLEPTAKVTSLVPEGYVLKKGGYKWWSEFNKTEKEIIPAEERKLWTTDSESRGEFPALHIAENAGFDGEALELKVKDEDVPFGDFEDVHGRYREHGEKHETTDMRVREKKKLYSTSFVKNVNVAKYGYFETICKLGDSTLASTLRLKEYTAAEEGGRGREIVVFSYSASWARGRHGAAFSRSLLTDVRVKETDFAASKPKFVDAQTDLHKEKYVKIGLLWTATMVYWLLNNEVVRAVDHGGEFRDAEMFLEFEREYVPMFGEPGWGDGMGALRVFYHRGWALTEDGKLRSPKVTRLLSQTGKRGAHPSE